MSHLESTSSTSAVSLWILAYYIRSQGVAGLAWWLQRMLRSGGHQSIQHGGPASLSIMPWDWWLRRIHQCHGHGQCWSCFFNNSRSKLSRCRVKVRWPGWSMLLVPVGGGGVRRRWRRDLEYNEPSSTILSQYGCIVATLATNHGKVMPFIIRNQKKLAMWLKDQHLSRRSSRPVSLPYKKLLSAILGEIQSHHPWWQRKYNLFNPKLKVHAM